MTIEVTASEMGQAEIEEATKSAQGGEISDPAEQKEESEASGTEEPKEKETESKESDEAESKESEESEDSEGEDKDEDDDSGEEEEEKPKPKKKGGFQRRIDKLNAQKAEAKKEAEYWRKIALEKEQSAKSEDSESVDKEDAPKNADGRPNQDDFDTYEEYTEALTDWKVEQRFKAKEEEERTSQLKSEQEKTLKSHNERVQAFREKTSDYDEVIEGLAAEVDDEPVSPAFEAILVNSDNGPEILYELAKDPEEFKRVNSLTPLNLAREIGRLESRLTSNSAGTEKKESKQVTKAPPPITPVKSKGGKVTKSLYDPNLTQREYEELRRAQSAS